MVLTAIKCIKQNLLRRKAEHLKQCCVPWPWNKQAAASSELGVAQWRGKQWLKLLVVYGLVKGRDHHSVTSSIQAIFSCLLLAQSKLVSIGLSLFCLLPLALSTVGFAQTHPSAPGRVGSCTEIRVTVSGVSSGSLEMVSHASFLAPPLLRRLAWQWEPPFTAGYCWENKQCCLLREDHESCHRTKPDSLWKLRTKNQLAEEKWMQRIKNQFYWRKRLTVVLEVAASPVLLNAFNSVFIGEVERAVVCWWLGMTDFICKLQRL